MHITTTRTAINNQISRFCTAAGISHVTDWTTGPCVHVINGRRYTPGQAADLYLPGGFDGSYERTGQTPVVRVGQVVKVTVDGVLTASEVILVVGAKRYDDGFVAVARTLPATAPDGTSRAVTYTTFGA